MEIYKAPPILIIHFKRFKTIKNNSYYSNSNSKKITSLIDFPIEKLNLSQYVLN